MSTRVAHGCYPRGFKSPLGHVNPHQSVSRLGWQDLCLLDVLLQSHAGRCADDDRVSGAELVGDLFWVLDREAEPGGGEGDRGVLPDVDVLRSVRHWHVRAGVSMAAAVTRTSVHP